MVGPILCRTILAETDVPSAFLDPIDERCFDRIDRVEKDCGVDFLETGGFASRVVSRVRPVVVHVAFVRPDRLKDRYKNCNCYVPAIVVLLLLPHLGRNYHIVSEKYQGESTHH